ncbi:GGDEF domain-containing protein [Aliikangiella sp. G2MR2-5]|uniref:GGDEF domain-containing protein n=1 Tax=Aliikangiella sp. G2MR2-5 TaxID=2788943 RepID=UPI0018ABEA6B|nr:GGDEF domain-containing protein [Aliikangiella sp. G2MR2-5]
MDRRILRPLQAGLLAFGAPLGWLFIRLAQGVNLQTEIMENLGLYLYMLIGTLVVFIMYGFYVGQKEQIISDLAVRDGLTKTYNHRYFVERLEQSVSQSIRKSSPLSLVYFDLDYFKRVNDLYGHPKGDEVLIGVVSCVSSCIRQYDTFARLGGEEFAILMPDVDLEKAASVSQRICQQVEKLVFLKPEGGQFKISISVGVVQRQEGEGAAGLYARADQMLYLAKDRGRNCVVSQNDSNE